MGERKGIITFQGNPLTLVGPELKAGDKAPDFRVVNNGLAPVTRRLFSSAPTRPPSGSSAARLSKRMPPASTWP